VSPSAKARGSLERAILTVSLVIFFIAGYFGVGASRNPDQARELKTFLDDQIPFIAGSVWTYLLIFPSALLPLFVVRCRRLFRRTAVAYAIAITVSVFCFAFFPVSSIGLRAGGAMLDPGRASDWAVATLYSIDPPYNLFPSLHLSIAVLAAFSVWKATRRYGIAAFVTLIVVGVSVCTVKQHVVLDVAGGGALGALVSFFVLRPYRPQAGVEPAYSWRGPLLYVAFLVVVYTGFYVTFYIASRLAL
jgi:membrane-associated phospholipid phosphatase